MTDPLDQPWNLEGQRHGTERHRRLSGAEVDLHNPYPHYSNAANRLTRDGPRGLPIKHDLGLAYALSIAIAIVMAVASVTGLLYKSDVYPTAALVRTFVPNDVVNLFIGVPMLLGSMWLSRRGSLSGLLLWPGALFFALYSYIVYAFAMPFGEVFLLDLSLVMLSAYAMVALVGGLDGHLVQSRLAGHVPERLAGGMLAGLGGLFFLQALGAIIAALVSQTQIAGTDLAVHMGDFLTTPAWVIGGAFLWRRREFGYLTGLGLLFQASMLFIGLIAFMLLQPFLTDATLSGFDLAVIFALGLTCIVPFALFVRGVTKAAR